MSDHQLDSDDTENTPAVPLPTVVHRTNSADDDIDPRVAEILDDYFEKLQTGTAPTAEEILAAHPEHAEELAACLDGINLVQDATSDPGNPLKSIQRLGDFRIIREVGRGGMGVVYEAEQISLKRRVALKVLRYMVADREAMERFQREAETVASLHHSNIVPIFAVGEADGVNYFAMQFIDGESLADIQQSALEEQTSFDSLDIANWGLQTAEALAYAHDHDIIHRDVKPSNLIRDEEGRIWLTDFGLAKRLDDVQLSMTGAILGTPRYMSPEQANSVKTPVDHRTDIYSLGATLYEFATGKPLFDAQSAHAALGSILSEDPVPPRTVRPSLPRDLETIIMRCLSKDAVHRYESAAELVTDLRAFIDGRPINARRPSVVEQVGRWLLKNQRQVTTAVTAAAIAAALLIGTRVAIQEYRESQLGRIQVESTRKLPSPVVATILDKNGTQVVPSFTLPTQQLVEVPRGDYELQLQSDGELTDHYHVSVYPSPTPKLLETHLEDRNLWKPTEITSEWAIWHREDSDDIVVFDDDGVTLLDAATKDTIWRSDLSSELSLLGIIHPHRKNEKWSWRPQQMRSADFHEQPAIVANNIDCDQDGIADLILACQYQPMVLALSGSTGGLLWRSCIQHEENQTSYEKGTVRGAPLVTDLNDDSVPDFLTCFCMTTLAGPGTRCCVRAVNGADGSTLWHQEVDPTLLKNPQKAPYPPHMARWHPEDDSFSDTWAGMRRGMIYAVDDTNESHVEHGGFLAPYPLQFLPESNDSLVFFVGDSLILIDSKTGDFAKTHKLSGIPVRAPQWVDADNSETPELLICYRNLPNPANLTDISVTENPALRLELWDFKTATPLWKQDIEANWEWGMSMKEVASSNRQWPLICDIDHDGTTEIILAATSTAAASRYSSEPFGHLQLLDARNGQRKWKSPPVVNIDCQLSYFTVVNDLDNDGFLDVAATSRFSRATPDQQNERHVPFSIYVDVFSGKDGTQIRRMDSASHVRGANGLPGIHGVHSLGDKLAVELRRGSQNSFDRSLLFDLQSESCEGTLNDVQRLTPIKTDDATRAIACWTPNKPGESRQGGMLRVFRQRNSPAPSQRTWKYADQHLNACGDVNGDGVEDAVGTPDKSGAINMVSGATGEYLWSAETPFVHATPTMRDFDGDGAPDIAVSYLKQNPHDKVDTPIALMSGRTGGVLWRLKLDKEVDWMKQKLTVEDLDRDGQIDLLVFAETDYLEVPKPNARRWDLPWCVLQLNGQTGEIMSSTAYGNVGRNAGQMLASFQDVVEDLDGDDQRDVVGYDTDPQGMLRLRAISGQDGTEIWGDSELPDQAPGDNRTRYPHFCSVETNQATTIVSAATLGYQSGGTGPDRQRLVVKAIDGTNGKDLWEWIAPMYRQGSGRGIDRESKKYGEEVPVHVRTQHGSRIGIWHTNKDSVEFSLLNLGPDEVTPNRVAETFTIHKWPNGGPDWTFLYQLRVWAEDLDSDGFDELIYTTPTSLVAYSLSEKKALWTRPFIDRQKVEAVDRLADGSFEIRFWTLDEDYKFDTLTAINGQGDVVWTERRPDAWHKQQVNQPPDLLRVESSLVPKILYRLQNQVTVCRSATPKRAKASSLADAAKTPRPFAIETSKASAANDPRLLRPALRIGKLGSFTGPLFKSILIVFVPIVYLCQLFRGRWTLKVLLLAPLITAISLVGLRWPAANVPQNFSGAIAWNFHQAIMFALTIVPTGYLLVLAANRIKERRWSSLSRFLPTIAICVVGCVILLVILERRSYGTTLQVRYEWHNVWHGALFLGVHFSGILLICWHLIQFVRGWISRRRPGLSRSVA